MSPSSRLALALMLALTLAGCTSGVQILSGGKLVSSYTAEDGRQILAAILSHPDIKAVADKVAPLKVRAEVIVPIFGTKGAENGWNVEVTYSERVDTFDYDYANGAVTNASGGSPDFTVKTTQSIALDVINADDGLRIFACALEADAVTLEATNPLYGASFNAARDRIVGSATDCEAKVGDAVTWKGHTGVIFAGENMRGGLLRTARMDNDSGDYMTFDKYRAPIGWYPASDDLCKNKDCKPAGYVGYSAGTRDMRACGAEVEKAYAAPSTDDGWQSGLKVSAALKKSAELAACKLVFGGGS